MKQILLVIGLCYGSFCMAQNEEIAKNTLYLEMGGNGFLYSLNYDRILHAAKEDLLIGARIGLGGSFPLSFEPDDDIVLQTRGIPLEVYTLVGARNSKFDVGIGIYPNYVYKPRNDEAFKVDFFANIGYRYQRPSGGFFFKTGFVMQHFSMYGINSFAPWLKLGFGYTFR